MDEIFKLLCDRERGSNMFPKEQTDIQKLDIRMARIEGLLSGTFEGLVMRLDSMDKMLEEIYAKLPRVRIKCEK